MLSAGGLGVDCADVRRSRLAVRRCCAWCVRYLNRQLKRHASSALTNLPSVVGGATAPFLSDADTHDVIDLLEDPAADALVSWLDDHPGVQVICRDRDGVHASAATRGAPDAMQVADRWHIVHNLVAALERMAVRVLAPLHKQHAIDDLARLDNQRKAANLQTQSRIEMRNERRHAEIHALRNKGLTIDGDRGSTPPQSEDGASF